MQSKYFTIKVPIAIPSVATNGQHAVFADTHVLFNWTGFQMPRGGAKLLNVGLIAQCKLDAGATVNEFPVDLLFATSNASDLGALNTVPPETGWASNIVGMVEITADQYQPDLDSRSFADASRADTIADTLHGWGGGIVLAPAEPLSENSKTALNPGFSTMYIGGIAKDAWDFRSVMRSTAAKTVADDVAVAVDAVDPRKTFAIGDVLVNTTTADTSVQTALGTVSALGANLITFEGQPGSALGAAVADDDYIYNKYPITLVLHFER